MTTVTTKVEIGFVANPFLAPGSITWTDVTAYTDPSWSAQLSGRNNELDRNQAGSLTLQLKNTDGRFDPGNTSSPYYPYVLARRPVRVTATYSSVSYGVFYGFIKGWPMKWTSGGTYGYVTVTAVDAMSTALAYKFPAPFSSQMAQDAAHFWEGKAAADTGYTGGMGAWSNWGNLWGLNTNFTDPSLASDPGQNCLTATFAANSRGGGTVDAYTAATVTGGALGTFTGQGGADFRFRLVSADSLGTHQYYNLFMRTPTKLNAISIGPSATGPSGYAIYYTVYATSTTVTNSPTTATKLMDIATATTYYVALVPHNGSDVTVSGVDVYVNGSLVTSSLTEMTWAQNTWPDVLTGRWLGQGNNAAVWPQGLSVKFDTPALYDTTNPLTSTIATAHYNGTVTASGQPRYSSFASELTSARVSDVLDAIGWPSGLRTLDTGATTMIASGSVQGTTALDLLAEAANTELGNLFVDGSGNVVFHNRAHRTGATSQATFGELTGSGEFPYQGDIEIDFDETQLYNDIQITQTGSSPTYVNEQQDFTSQASNGPLTLTRSISANSRSDVAGMAGTLLAWYLVARQRCPTVTLEGRSRPANFPQMLGRKIGDLVTVKRRAPGANSISLDCFIDGISHSVSETSWATTFNLTPKYPDPTY